MLDSLIVSLLLLVLGMQGGMWYKLGRVEQRLKDHLNQHSTTKD